MAELFLFLSGPFEFRLFDHMNLLRSFDGHGPGITIVEVLIRIARSGHKWKPGNLVTVMIALGLDLPFFPESISIGRVVPKLVLFLQLLSIESLIKTWFASDHGFSLERVFIQRRGIQLHSQTLVRSTFPIFEHFFGVEFSRSCQQVFEIFFIGIIEFRVLFNEPCSDFLN